MTLLRGCISALGLACAAAVSGAHALVLSEADRGEICAEAANRYRDIFGRAAQDEPFAVVMMFKDNFCPQSITVTQGSKVRWVNVDKRTSHSVWFKDAGKPESDRVFAEEVVDLTVDWPPGEYPYLCGPHWEKEGMVGRLTVTGR